MQVNSRAILEVFSRYCEPAASHRVITVVPVNRKSGTTDLMARSKLCLTPMFGNDRLGLLKGHTRALLRNISGTGLSTVSTGCIADVLQLPELDRSTKAVKLLVIPTLRQEPRRQA